MGPIALFDKSFLQMLSVDEAMWFDHFFIANICPLFYVETLADLEKVTKSGRSPEDEVRVIADKTPYMGGGPCVYHGTLCLAELQGYKVPMTGQIPVAGGRPVNSGGKRGVVIDNPPEAQAFARWQEGRFLDLEREYARAWRSALANLDLPGVAEKFRALGISGKNCKTLAEAKSIAADILHSKARPFDQIALVFNFLAIPRQYHRGIVERWSTFSYAPLSQYAPYVSHVMEIEIFFQIALAANLISSDRASNRVDVAYLFYLPFCSVFVSGDKLHHKCAPLFMRPNQDFVWMNDLKSDLQNANLHFSALPEHVKEKGILAFAHHPPGDSHSLMVQLWDRHLPKWRQIMSNANVFEPVLAPRLADEVKRMGQSRPLTPQEVDFDPRDADALVIERLASKRRGNWWQLPADLQKPGDDI
jgi:hypothetical protein